MSMMKSFSILWGTIMLVALCAANNSHLSESAEVFLKSEALHKALLSLAWEAVIKAVPNDSNVARDARVLLLIGHASYGLGQNNAATAIFTLISDSTSLANWEKWTAALSAKNAGSPVAHYLYGDALARNAKYDQALKEFSEAVKVNEKFCLALNARGVVYDIKGDLNKASDDFEAVVECNPNFADVYANIGVVYLQRAYRGAGAQFEKAIKKDPAHGLAYNGKACYYASIGEIDTARNSIILANNRLKGNPYIIINAKTLNDSTNTNSVLSEIANQKMVADHRGLAQLAFALIPEVTIGGPKIFEMKWAKPDFLLKDIDALSPGWGRGGVYFNIQEGKNLKIVEIGTRSKISTEFTIGYPRPTM